MMPTYKRLLIYAALAGGYAYIWFDGGLIGKYLAGGCAGTTLLFLVLYDEFEKSAGSTERRDQA